MGIIEEGPYRGQRAWVAASGGAWVPECALADWERATYRDFAAAMHIDLDLGE